MLFCYWEFGEKYQMISGDVFKLFEQYKLNDYLEEFGDAICGESGDWIIGDCERILTQRGWQKAYGVHKVCDYGDRTDSVRLAKRYIEEYVIAELMKKYAWNRREAIKRFYETKTYDYFATVEDEAYGFARDGREAMFDRVVYEFENINQLLGESGTGKSYCVNQILLHKNGDIERKRFWNRILVFNKSWHNLEEIKGVKNKLIVIDNADILDVEKYIPYIKSDRNNVYLIVSRALDFGITLNYLAKMVCDNNTYKLEYLFSERLWFNDNSLKK
jgi:hypothetical protein